jgi:hypothetical protein
MHGIDFQDVYEISLEAEILNIDVSNSNLHRNVNVCILLSLKFMGYLLTSDPRLK